jgi:hypothetical protein
MNKTCIGYNVAYCGGPRVESAGPENADGHHYGGHWRPIREGHAEARLALELADQPATDDQAAGEAQEGQVERFVEH